jgi:hypothetical protein
MHFARSITTFAPTRLSPCRPPPLAGNPARAAISSTRRAGSTRRERGCSKSIAREARSEGKKVAHQQSPLRRIRPDRTLGTTADGLLLFHLVARNRPHNPAVHHGGPLDYTTNNGTKTVKDVPGQSVNHVLGLDKSARKDGAPSSQLGRKAEEGWATALIMMFVPLRTSRECC